MSDVTITFPAAAVEAGVSGGICHVYWGGHGCSLPRGHGGVHTCELSGEKCSQVIDRSGHWMARYFESDNERWSKWMKHDHVMDDREGIK